MAEAAGKNIPCNTLEVASFLPMAVFCFGAVSEL